MRLEEGGEAWTSIAEVRGKDGEIGKKRHVPRRQYGECIIVKGNLERTKRRQANAHASFGIGRVAQGFGENGSEIRGTRG